MRILSKYLFLFTLAIVNTSLAGLILYISPVLSYVGSVDQIPIIIEGLLSGAIVSSIFGFILSFIPHRLNIKVTLSIIFSLLIFTILTTIYFIDSPLPNSSVFLGSFASESFIMVFVVMFYVSTGNATVKNRLFSAVLMFIFNVLVFIMVAIIYLSLGQSDFPYILETIIVVSIISMIPFLGVKNMEPKSSKE